MPRVTTTQNNFTAGEVSPKCYGRTDVSRYQNGAKTLLNCLVQIHGGAQRRMGKRFIAEIKDSTQTAKLVPFVFSRDQAYMLEFGDQYMRVYVQSGGQVLDGAAAYEIATPYTQAMLPDIDYTQGADTMFIFHSGVLIHTLKRYAADKWVMKEAPFSMMPFDEIGHNFNATLTLSAATVGTGRTATASTATFYTGDVGRRISYLGGLATITGYTSTTVVTVEITVAFTTTALPVYDWTLEDSPQGDMVPSSASPVGATIALTFGTNTVYEAIKTITSITHDGVTTVTVQVVGHGYATADRVIITGVAFNDGAGLILPIYNGSFNITVIDADNFSYPLATDPGLANVLGAVRRQVTTTTDGLRAVDVDKLVRINGGLIQVSTITSPTTGTGVILQELTSVVAASPGAWSLEASVWNTLDGYPRTGALFEQRLIAAGTDSAPQTIWGSRSSFYYDFLLGTADDDAFAFVMPSTGQINPITRMSTLNSLVPLSYGGEFTITGGVEKPLTPTNRQIKDPSTYGCNSVKPVRIGNELFFVQRAGRKVRAFSYKSIEESYKSPDLTVLAEHITRSGVVDMAYQQESTEATIEANDFGGSILWCVLANGKMAALTVDREEGVTAWTSITTDGFYESVATIPNATGGDEVWVIVRRVIGGVSQRYVERFDETYLTDSAIKGTSGGAGSTVWTGLDYLEGKLVVAKEGNTIIGRYTVASGQITLSRAANAVEIGLDYTNTIALLRPELQASDGSAQGNNMRTHEVSLLFKDTIGGTINDHALAFREFDVDHLDTAAEVYSGLERLALSGWERGDSPIVISQTEPLPFHLLAVIRKFTVNS